MSTTLKPCHCGYSGVLAGMREQGFLSLICPRCNRSVQAFTIEGLAENWNKPAELAQSKRGGGDD